MEDLISLLEAVYSTMDTIAVMGISNQDKFVGCANAVKNVSQKLQELNAAAKEAIDG